MVRLSPRLPDWLPGPSLLLLGLLIFLPAIWNWPLIRAEGMYALIPKEMYLSGHWLTPTLNGARYLDKPPLFYWLNLTAYHLFGVSDRAVRLPTLLIGLGEVWLTYLIGRRRLGTPAAGLGALVLLTSIGFFTLHLQLLTDHLVTLGLMGALAVLVYAEDHPTWPWSVLFMSSLAVGFLSKGFIGLAFPLLILGGYAWYRHQPRLLSLVLDPRGWLVFLALTVPWFAAMEQAYPGFLRHHIVNEQILRFLGRREPADITPFPLSGFWLFLFIWLLPWGLLLPGALYRFWQQTAGPDSARRARLLLIWAALIMIFFSVSSSRIEYYSLPALPPLALVVGWSLAQSLEAGQDRSLPLALLVLGFLGLALLFLLPYLEQLCAANRREFYGMFPLLRPVARRASIWVPVLALGGALLGRRRPSVALSAYGALAVLLLFFTWQAMTALSPLLSDQLPGEYLRRQAGPRDPVVMEAIEEFEYGASLAFYSGHPILIVQRHGLPRFPYPVPPKENYLITPEELKKKWQGSDRVFLLVDDVIPPEPYFKGAQVVLTLPGRRLLCNKP
uniref:Glycosyltransferase RgtA/B/C/D-like domain-containing protein n=1 Tax=Desulfobacca acetoxidans TaxID=60893 RepID=A0A7C3UW09_9BACT